MSCSNNSDNYSSQSNKKDRFDRKVLVSGLPEGTTENGIIIHFQKKKNGGGEIENVTCMSGGKATVVFEDIKVAKTVVNTKQMFKGNVLEVKRLGIETTFNTDKLGNEECAREKQRTVQVSGLPEGSTENSIEIHFQKKRNGGGDIESVTCLPGGKATVVFADPRVAEEVVKTEQTFKGRVLEVKLMKMAEKPSVEELRTEESAEKKQARTVQVSGLPEGTTEGSVQIHFGKKTNGGGDIESVTCLTGGKATVVFADPKVAEEVVKTEQTFKGRVLEVKLMKMAEKPSVKELRTEESVEKKQARTVQVSGLPEGTTKGSVQIHFGKNRNGGGDIESVTCLTGGKAMVVFEDIKVAKRVVNTEQIFKGNVLEMKHLDTETKTYIEEENGGENQARAILVSGLPEGATENSVHIHFQKKRNGGGEVEKVKLLEKGNAMVVFEDPEVAQKVVNTPQKLGGKSVNVKYIESEALMNEVLSGKPEISKPEGWTVLVSGLPDGATENGVHIHFQKKKNGGGEITEVKLLPERNEALVTFEDIEVAKTVVKTPQEMKGQSLTVNFWKQSSPKVNKQTELATSEVVGAPEGRKLEETKLEERNPEERKLEEDKATALGLQSIDPVFSVVSATINPALMITVASEQFWTDVFNVMQKSCGVHCQTTAYGIMITGTLSQVTRAGELLAVHWRKHCQDPLYNNVFNQGATTTHQSGSTFNQVGMTAYQSGPNFNQGGMTTNQSRPNFNERGTTNSIDNLLGGGEFESGKQVFVKRTESEFPNENDNFSLHLRNQQSGWNGEGQWQNESNSNMDSNFTREVHNSGNASYKHPHSDHGTQQYVEEPPSTKLPGFKENIENPQPFEGQQYTPSTCMTESFNSNFVGEARASEDTKSALSVQPSRSPHSTRNLKQSGDGKTTDTTTDAENPASKVDGTSLQDKSGLDAKPSSSPSETKDLQHPGAGQMATDISTDAENPTPKVVGTSSLDKPYLNAKPSSSPSETKDLQQPGAGQMATDISIDAENPTTKEVGTSSLGKPDLNAKPSSSSSETRHPQPPTDNQKSTTVNPTTGPENDTTDPSSEKPPTTSPKSTTNHQPPLSSQEGTPADPGPENLTTPKNQNGFPSKGRQDSLPIDKPSSSPDSARNPQQPGNQQGGTPNITRAQNPTTSNNPLESPSTKNLISGSKNPQSAQDSTMNPQQPGQRGATTDPSNASESLTTSSDNVRSPSNTKQELFSENPPNLQDSSTYPQSSSNDQQGTTPNTTIGPNSTISKNQIGVSSSDRPDSHGGKPSIPAVKTPNDQPKDDQQTTPDEISNKPTPAPENLNKINETTPGSKPSVKPRTSTENNPNSKNKPQKRTPIPVPRQNKPSTNERRQNAANFSSSSMKAAQNREGTL